MPPTYRTDLLEDVGGGMGVPTGQRKNPLGLLLKLPDTFLRLRR